MNYIKIAGFSLVLFAFACGNGPSQDRVAAPEEEDVIGDTLLNEALSRPPAPVEMVVPAADPRRGRILFISNGCVICHQVNGVGGAAAPALDMPGSSGRVDPVEFSARMWRGASAMSALQSIELGYVIELNGQDIADIAAFTASPAERALLTLDSVPVEMRDWFLDMPYWRTDEWSEYEERGERIPFDDMP